MGFLSSFFTFIFRSLFWAIIISFSLGVYTGMELLEYNKFNKLNSIDSRMSSDLFPRIHENMFVKIFKEDF